MSASQTPPEKAVQTLAVIPSVITAYGHLFSNLRAVPAAICMPVLIYLLWYAIVRFVDSGAPIASPDQATQMPGAKVWLLLVIGFLVQVFTTSLLYVVWLRLALLGPAGGWPRFFYPVDRRHVRFFGTALLVVAIVFSSVLLIGFVAGLLLPQSIAMAIVVIAYLVLLVKFSFIFPAIAVDETYGLRNAWQQSTGQEHRLVAGFFLCLLPALLLSLMVNWDVFSQLMADQPVQASPAPFWVDAFLTLFGILNGLAVISYLSIAFKTCTGWVPEAPESRALGPWES